MAIRLSRCLLASSERDVGRRRHGCFSAWALALSVGCATSACRLHDVDPTPAPIASVPDAFSESGGALASADPWWEAFGDPALNQLVADALASNFDLKAAWARLERAEALARKTRGGLFPALGIDASASRGQQTFTVGGPIGTVTNKSSQFALSLAASYEVDLWGRIASLVDAENEDTQASRQDVESMAMTLAAHVAQTWFRLVESRAQRALLQAQLEVSRTYLELVELRFGQGQATALDVYQQRQQVSSIESQVPTVESGVAVLRHQLAVLVGKPPRTEVATEQTVLPTLGPLPPTGVPADLLVRRPDLRSAQARVVAADHRLASAVADLLPAIRLSGKTGYQGPDISDLFENWMWNLAGSLTAPVFEGGRRKAEVDRARAVLTEQAQSFSASFLSAVREVEDALVQEHKHQEYLSALERQLDVAQANLREARARYVNGLASYLNVLNALSSTQKLERDHLRARRERITYRIQLCRALGGSWTRDLKPEDPVVMKTGGAR